MIVRILAIILASLTLAPSLHAQDRFGDAVAVVDGDVLVLKPGATRGLPAVFVHRRGPEGEWLLLERLRSALASEGAASSASMSAVGPRLIIVDGGVSTTEPLVAVGGGDPDGVRAAHILRRSSTGRWSAEPGVRLRDEAPAGAPASVDLATVMRILQPPHREVLLLEDTWRRSTLAVASQSERGAVRVFRRDGDGDWSPTAVLRPPAPDSAAVAPRIGFGAALAAAGRRIAVAAPGSDAGAVYVHAQDAAGAWTLETVLRAEDGVAATGFGSALAAADSLIAVQAPVAREVLLYRAAVDGWILQQRLPAPDSAAVSFGAAMAVAGNELWIGDPHADDGRGRVYRYVGDDSGGTWRQAGVIEPDGLSGPAEFGASIALSHNRLVDGWTAAVGAPGALGNSGRAAVFTSGPYRPGVWSGPVWLTPGSELEAVAEGEVRCEGGDAAGFDCEAVDLLAFLPLAHLGAEPAERVSDLWGWTDPETGREYALVGRSAGLAVVDVTEPTTPVLVGLVPAESSGARDIKVYADHAFMTGDGTRDHGLVIFDLTRVRDAEPGTTFEPDTRYTGITSAHNLVIDTESGFAFTVDSNGGGNTCGGGLHMIDIRAPLQPTFAGCYTDTHGLIAPGRTHDAQCVVYDGPDAEHRGRQICFASNETALRIVDVTDKDAPTPIAAATYPGMAYVHQGWLTDDHRYFFLDDELDELVGLADHTRTLVWDIEDLDDPVLVHEYFGPNGATDHNLYIRGNRMYQANYQAGLRVIDISDPTDPVEIGSFDTTPYDADPPGFVGTWTAFPYFQSGTVIVSSMYEGLFVLKPRSGLTP